ncbi:tyrosine-type recombinase/integrase [Psychromarinibacter sp. C21-152]|uniref:Tyrosine-type recombinase/integrase n=1 Tax=Psychromarinibacter sediminicola TaxID=3033385 RepID=A0AAE3NVP7_9RHOB|nr:site-specific integrase [Psychromarinibacter sediminicola]MDF0602997.1 tyrosine-type recombinase/integrase [Psychromarinibacter sediminicola]
MPKGKLTVSKTNKLTAPGRYADGNCLFLVVSPSGAKQWVARLTIHGKQTDLGLGGHTYTSLEEAREECAKLRKVARNGGDPRTERRKLVLTFEDAARRVHAGLLPTWRSAGHGQRWLASLEHYAFPIIGERPINTLGPSDVLSVLSPIWTEKNDTAKRIKQRMASVFDWAKGAGHYAAENPLTGLEKALPSVRSAPIHMAALPWRELPKFMGELSRREAVSARALAFLILTATRSRELRGARWSEIDGKTWTIPADRMKTGKEHKIPLSAEALSILESVQGIGDDLIFPSATRGSKSERPLSDTVFKALMDRMGYQNLTAHGFRSTFRDWCGEHAKADREVAEAALAHSFGSKVERAYARSDLFQRRRQLMSAWGRYAKGTS